MLKYNFRITVFSLESILETIWWWALTIRQIALPRNYIPPFPFCLFIISRNFLQTKTVSWKIIYNSAKNRSAEALPFSKPSCKIFLIFKKFPFSFYHFPNSLDILGNILHIFRPLNPAAREQDLCGSPGTDSDNGLFLLHNDTHNPNYTLLSGIIEYSVFLQSLD